MSVAFVFPGQGAFRAGCLDPWAGHPAAGVLDEVAAGLDRDVRALAGDAGTASRTADAQPAILAASLVAWRAVTRAGLRADLVAGHSLGEITAAVAAESLSATEAARLVAVRGAAMGRACRAHPGTMSALVRLTPDQVTEVLGDEEDVVVANDNAPGQVVVAGPDQGVARVAERAREAGGRALPIEVEGAFHSPAMAGAVPEVTGVVDDLAWRAPTVPLVSGTTGAPCSAAEDVRTAIVEGILSPVRWREVQTTLAAAGVTTLVELGPGGVLRGLAKRTVPDLEVVTVAEPEQAEEAAAALAGAG